MIYMRIKFLSCVLLTALLSIAYSKPTSDLRKKLERLLRDSEYDEVKNEIIRPRQIQGMILKDLREHNLFDSSSEERFYALLNRLEKNPGDASNLSEEIKSSSTTTTTTTTTTTESSSTAVTSTQATLGAATNPTITKATATSKQKSPSIIGGIERLSSIVSRFIDLWRKS